MVSCLTQSVECFFSFFVHQIGTNIEHKITLFSFARSKSISNLIAENRSKSLFVVVFGCKFAIQNALGQSELAYRGHFGLSSWQEKRRRNSIWVNLVSPKQTKHCEINLLNIPNIITTSAHFSWVVFSSVFSMVLFSSADCWPPIDLKIRFSVRLDDKNNQ